MSADTTEQNRGGGDDLRARYLPVSRKELRRRREAELVGQREPEAEAGAVQAGQDSADTTPEQEASADHAAEIAGRALADTEAAEGDVRPEQPEQPEQPEPDELEELGEPEAEPAGETEADPGEPAEDDATAEDDAEVEDSEPADESQSSESAEEPEPQDVAVAEDRPEIPAEAPAVRLPEPPRPAEEPARPEEEIADAEAEDPDDLPGSRRARRLLRETQSIPPLSPELLAELDATNAEVAKNDDPNRVDPDLLKKQQALAAKAMQANQERMRREHAEKEKERRRKLRERPESQVLTERMVRDSLDQDPEEMQYATGQIEPVHAQGAHGLDLNKMIDATARQADRQNVLVWLVVILALLLVAAIAAVVYFMVL
ncbi:hypothetical protein [Nesterenkonia alkaliphila]|uniref:Uncharacterized protein n=1 Tax=Nesterenkonia alkaliphila TaxID=1463631 RepID=A0A7K1UKL1_9MICC|nr:hypothetical protein [Nesterenkonia alkaliphila]MVT27028.1 hypothetical protein [Nesterenkonia alkaliphila]GFZ94051.1 hypothetical protein GCM10011359_24450 [Nesterenkonia alkaliphila]